MDIVGQTYRTKAIRHDLKKPTIVEFLRDGEVISGTFKIDKRSDNSDGPFISTIDCDTKACWIINADTIQSLTILWINLTMLLFGILFFFL